MPMVVTSGYFNALPLSRCVIRDSFVFGIKSICTEHHWKGIKKGLSQQMTTLWKKKPFIRDCVKKMPWKTTRKKIQQSFVSFSYWGEIFIWDLLRILDLLGNSRCYSNIYFVVCSQLRRSWAFFMRLIQQTQCKSPTTPTTQ